MSGTGKAKNKIQELAGKAQEAVGKITGDKSTENKGKADQTKTREGQRRVQKLRAASPR